MRIALDPGPRDGPVRVRRLTDDGTPLAGAKVLPGLAAVADLEREHAPRWVLARPRTYRRLLAAGVRVGRAHDVELVEGLLVAAAGRYGEPHGLAAAAARLAGRAPDPDPPLDADGDEVSPGLFDTGPARDELADVVAVHAAQVRALTDPRMRLLAAAESAGALVAEEMTAHGLPWSAAAHDALLTELLGPRPVLGGRPPALAALAAEVDAAFGRPVNSDSPAELLRAFARAGHELTTTRAWELRRVAHPAVAPLLAYKELARLHAAHGWSWLATWVRDGRFRPEYVVGGVVTGRWATRGGGALQIPRTLRGAVRADPGWRLVVADAAQLEPRVLAALSGDHALAPDADDLYAALAAREFGGDRGQAKLALLSAMYGASAGQAGELVARLRRRYPAAMAYVDGAARDGEAGRLVRSHLGRTCPPARPGDEEPARARARGRFTRNFVVQATAAEWALVLLAELRLLLRGGPAELVFFQHDEVLLHCPAEVATDVVDAIATAADTARRRLFGDTPVRFPLQSRVVGSYDEPA
ncbi:bifunctional 3'-5' exonuclease/DNA polymerase [Pseudonocardia broussonetiae]|uniref:DNA-directed DNA polymerase n=1 Tax=Pseudonocardia broussonetiae TaxID=2736640 RepID=A0A6M6JMN3_9PSEU|nr:bifunctional 3'-5' exonuclease/DNA polymerase [Pseudonocardia broussonetiae]QJY48595.1 bifunctional 3'-5' exonuclease/DNA polymerase [Pseudonocardia broussonetiae]